MSVFGRIPAHNKCPLLLNVHYYLTPADPYMTFDPSIALRFGQGFFPLKLVAIGHC